MVTKDGGPAFPTAEVRDLDGNVKWTPGWGMSLRDWFAGQALAGILADHTTNPTTDAAAGHAYRFADAMLAERAKAGD